jgi:predicted nucleotidyltransferase
MGKPYSIEEIKNRIINTAKQYGVKRAYIFGSYARGEAKPESDIDICIEKGNIRTLFELSGFCQDLEDSLEHKVDVITTAALSDAFKRRIEKDMVLVYG